MSKPTELDILRRQAALDGVVITKLEIALEALAEACRPLHVRLEGRVDFHHYGLAVRRAMKLSDKALVDVKKLRGMPGGS